MTMWKQISINICKIIIKIIWNNFATINAAAEVIKKHLKDCEEHDSLIFD